MLLVTFLVSIDTFVVNTSLDWTPLDRLALLAFLVTEEDSHSERTYSKAADKPDNVANRCGDTNVTVT